MVFQSTLLPGGAVVAIGALQLRRRSSGRAIATWAAFSAAFVAYVVVAA
jgi:hypothetical protein